MSKSQFVLPLLLVSSLVACADSEGMGGVNDERADELSEGADAGTEEEVDDGYAAARDVDLAEISFDEDTLAPEFYSIPDFDADVSLGGTEFWQRWPGGESPTFSYSVGSDFGRRCMYASAVRFAAIMADPPEEIINLLETTNWGGRFFNWNDDYSEGTSSASGAQLWAWKTHLIKWISQTDADGTCFLPTRDMLIAVAVDCQETADANDGEIEGCSAG